MFGLLVFEDAGLRDDVDVGVEGGQGGDVAGEEHAGDEQEGDDEEEEGQRASSPTTLLRMTLSFSCNSLGVLVWW